MTYFKKQTKLAALLMIMLGFYSCETVIPAGVNFSSATGSGIESGGTQTVQIDLTRSIASDITVEVEYSGSADYSANSTSVDIPAGQTSAIATFFLIDNEDFNPGVTNNVIIRLVGISGPGVEEAGFGENITYTYDVEEDDMEVDLTWTPASGNAANYDLDLYVAKDGITYASSTSGSNIIETVIISGAADDGAYDVSSIYFGSGSPNVDVAYVITLKYPDGSEETNSDSFTPSRADDRTLWAVTKNGGSYSATQNPYGANGRKGAPSIQYVAK